MFAAYGRNTAAGIAARGNQWVLEPVPPIPPKKPIVPVLYVLKPKPEPIIEPRKTIHDLPPPKRRDRFFYFEIERRACKLFKLTKTELCSKRRNQEVVLARQFVMYWATRLTDISLPTLGRMLGGRDHTTCLHGKDAYRDKRLYKKRYLRKAR